MEISPTPGKELHCKIGRIAKAIAFSFLIGSFAVGSARAADNRGHDARGGNQHSDNRDRGRRAAPAYYPPQQDNYYAPPPHYYNAPDADSYDGAQPAPQGIELFFGL